MCRHEIPLTHHHKIANNEAFVKFYGRIPVEFTAALFYFHKKGIVQELIHKLKYKGHQEIGEMIGSWYAQELKSVACIKTVDCIIPVPLHPKKLKERGYNQVTSFGEALAKNLSITYNPDILIRKRYSNSQTKKQF